jgi:hypothetical protein
MFITLIAASLLPISWLFHRCYSLPLSPLSLLFVSICIPLGVLFAVVNSLLLLKWEDDDDDGDKED